MKAEIQEVLNGYDFVSHKFVKDDIRAVYQVSGETNEELFKNAYPYERSLRYMNGYYIRFADQYLNDEYRKWKKDGITIEMYYGGGVVD